MHEPLGVALGHIDMNINTQHAQHQKHHQWNDVKWKVIIKDKNKNIFTVGRTISISASGVLIETAESFKLHQIFPMMINVQIERKKQPIYTTAEVNHRVLKKHIYQINVLFKQILPKDQEFLVNLAHLLI